MIPGFGFGIRADDPAVCFPYLRPVGNIRISWILRAKGIVNGEGGWIEFDYVPEEHEIRAGHADYTGRLCVIGAKLHEDAIKHLFGV